MQPLSSVRTTTTVSTLAARRYEQSIGERRKSLSATVPTVEKLHDECVHFNTTIMMSLVDTTFFVASLYSDECVEHKDCVVFRLSLVALLYLAREALAPTHTHLFRIRYCTAPLCLLFPIFTRHVQLQLSHCNTPTHAFTPGTVLRASTTRSARTCATLGISIT